MADNIDHNVTVATLDGLVTFHGMGIIAVSTPKDDTPLTTKSQLIRRAKRTAVDELVKDKGVPILQYTSQDGKGLASLIYKPIHQLQVLHTLPLDLYTDLLWHSGWIFSNAAKPRPTGQDSCNMHSLTIFFQLRNLKCFFYQSLI